MTSIIITTLVLLAAFGGISLIAAMVIEQRDRIGMALRGQGVPAASVPVELRRSVRVMRPQFSQTTRRGFAAHAGRLAS